MKSTTTLCAGCERSPDEFDESAQSAPAQCFLLERGCWTAAARRRIGIGVRFLSNAPHAPTLIRIQYLFVTKIFTRRRSHCGNGPCLGPSRRRPRLGVSVAGCSQPRPLLAPARRTIAI